MPGPKRPLTAQEKERIIYLASQGTELSEIARELNIDSRRVSGFVRTMINSGKIPGLGTPSQTIPQAAVSMGTVAAPPAPQVLPQTPISAPAAAPQQAQVPASPAGVQEGWVGGRPVTGNVAGFQNPTAQVRTVIERKIPNDGILGEHLGEISRERICEVYGEGLYKVLRYEPGNKFPLEYEFQASAAYGPPRIPKRASMLGEQNRPAFQRPWGSNAPARPWDRSYDRGEEDDSRGSAPPPRPYFASHSRDSGLYDFARHSSMGDAAAAATTEAIKQLGSMQERTIEQLEKARTSGPDSFMTTFVKEQQTVWERRLQEDERRRADERKDEEAKWERRQREMENEHRRRQEESRLAHERELERIKAEAASRDAAAKEERRLLMDLQDKRAQIDRDEYKMRQEALQEELKRNREELKLVNERTEKRLTDVQNATASQIAESNERLEKELERERENLEREHKLKEKAMDQRNALEQQIIDIKKESLQSQGGDQIFATINTVIKEFSKGLEKIVDLKKLEAMTPEAQAAAVAKGTIDGNVMGEPKKEPAAQAPNPPQLGVVPNVQAPKGNGNGQGPAAPKGEQKTEESQMEQIIQDMLDKPFFRQVIKEWSLHVKTNQDPTTFANMYMEWMRDPLDHEGRKATTMFANFMKPREWSDMMKIMGPKLDKDVSAIFKSEAAADFYDGFKAMVVEQIKDYWEQFLAARKAQRAAQAAAGEAPAEAPAETQGETGKQ